MKRLLTLVLAVTIISLGVYMTQSNKTYSPTKIPYNNGFYAGPYNPKLPVIKP